MAKEDTKQPIKDTAKQSGKTPTKQSKKTPAKQPFFLVRWIKFLSDYFRGVFIELKKVSWPTRKELINHTMVVIGIVLVFTLFIYSFDTLFGFLFALIRNI